MSAPDTQDQEVLVSNEPMKIPSLHTGYNIYVIDHNLTDSGWTPKLKERTDGQDNVTCVCVYVVFIVSIYSRLAWTITVIKFHIPAASYLYSFVA